MAGIEPVLNLLRQGHGTYGINESILNLYNNCTVPIPLWERQAILPNRLPQSLPFEN